MEAVLKVLQGQWEDSVGRSIEVDGNMVLFNDGSGDDGSGAWKIEALPNGELTLRGARLRAAKTMDQPEWQYPTGAILTWMRPVPVAQEDVEWSGLFRAYKEELLALRRNLADALRAEDYEAAAAIANNSWTLGDGPPPAGASAEQQLRLAHGRELGPGTCFRHRRAGFHGVIVACEPWYNSPLARRPNEIGNYGPMQLQPFYHCLVDEGDKDICGGAAFQLEDGTTGPAMFVLEGEIEVCPDAFPVRNGVVKRMFRPSEEIRGYLPTQLLMDALRRHKSGAPFAIDAGSCDDDESEC